MQKCNEASTAVINAIGLKDPCSGHLRATRQACPNPFDKHSFLLARQLSFAAALVKDHQPCEPVLFVQLMPAANCVVVQHSRAVATSAQLQPSLSNTTAFARRTIRPSLRPSRASARSSLRSALLRKPGRIMPIPLTFFGPPTSCFSDIHRVGV